MHSTDDFLKTGIEAIKNAEKIIMSYFGKNINFQTKSDNSPVTIADQEAEKIIRETISKKFPDHNFFGEEGGRTNKPSDYLWTIDPIDGTRHFTRGLPFFISLLSLSYKGKTVLAIVNHPYEDTILTSIRDQGAYLNQKQKLSVSQTNSLSLVHAGTGSVKYFDQLGLLSQLTKLNWDISVLKATEESRTYTALAKGEIDAIALPKGYAWDFAAPTLILEEAGAKVTDLYGKPLDFSTDQPMTFLAANPTLHKLILPYFLGNKG
jgi:histidinol-phosphatase